MGKLVLCRVAAVKLLPVHHYSPDYIFSCPLGSLSELILSQLLHTNRINKTESSSFFSLIRSLFPEDLHSELILRAGSLI